MPKFAIEPHSRINKSFEITCPGELRLTVDYDDVAHGEVDLLAQYLVAVLNQRWIPLAADRCVNEDCNAFLEPISQHGPWECRMCGGPMEAVTLG